MFERESGVLLHPSSLPGNYGIGDIGPEARRWLDLLHSSQQTLWQMLPLTPPGTAFSPYQGRSSFAGDVHLISLEDLVTSGLLTEAELTLAVLPRGPVDFEQVVARKSPLLQVAAERFLARQDATQDAEFSAFCAEQVLWLRDYARYQVLKQLNAGAAWMSWPVPERSREPSALQKLDAKHAVAIQREMALQFLFEKQWRALRQYADARAVRLIGDLPIFVALDSADVWAAQQLFRLLPDGSPEVVAGVPPDYFSATGQRWGNPLYAWDAHREQGFAWWTERVRRTLEMTHILRIDHFRGFAAFWEIPADEPTAVKGHWVDAPGYELFEQLRRKLGANLPIIAEDLGIITDDVVALRDHFEFPTMRVLQFSFGGEEKLLPHTYPRHCVAYTGTHDNDTTVGWFWGSLDNETPAERESRLLERDRVRQYYHTDGTDIQWTAIRELMAGQAEAVIFPLQDILGLDSSHRMNTPGTVGPSNWTWRFDWSQVRPELFERLRGITETTGRNQRVRGHHS
jgi:4-alpha-glucanotransferase